MSESPIRCGRTIPTHQLRYTLCQVLCFYLAPGLVEEPAFSKVASCLQSYSPVTIFSSVQSISHVWLFVTPWTAACQAFLFITNSWSLLKLMSIELVMPSSHLILCCPLLILPSTQYQGLFKWVTSLHQVAKGLEFQVQHQSFQWTPRTDLLLDGLVGSPCSPRDSQESSPTPQFKSINSSALRFLYSLALTSIYDYWKNHSLDSMNLCWQINVSAF